MHRWFRFCGRFALLHCVAATPFLALSTLAQEPTSSPETKEETNTPEASAIPHPTPGKHQLKVTPLQMVQHQADLLAQKLETQNALIATLTQQVDEQKKEIEALKEQNETLTTNLTMLEGQVSNLSDTIEEMNTPEEASPKHAAAPSTSVTPSTPLKVAGRSKTTPEELRLPDETEEDLPPASGVTHVVERGENLITIARKYGTSASDLLKLNRIHDERKLQIGQRLMIPAGGASSTQARNLNEPPSTP